MHFHNRNKHKYNISPERAKAKITTMITTAKTTTANLLDQLTSMFHSKAAYATSLYMLQLYPLEYVMCERRREVGVNTKIMMILLPPIYPTSFYASKIPQFFLI